MLQQRLEKFDILVLESAFLEMRFPVQILNGRLLALLGLFSTNLALSLVVGGLLLGSGLGLLLELLLRLGLRIAVALLRRGFLRFVLFGSSLLLLRSFELALYRLLESKLDTTRDLRYL